MKWPAKLLSGTRCPGQPFSDAERESYRLRRYEQMMTTRVAFPLVMFSPLQGRGRCQHKAGWVWRIDDPAWHEHAPSCGDPDCACSIDPVEEELLDEYREAGVNVVMQSG